MRETTKCEMILFEDIDFDDPIFTTLRLDYPDFERWRKDALNQADTRCAFVVRAYDDSYAGIAILKWGEAPDGPSRAGMKLSTFRVTPNAQAQGVADILLSRVFERAIKLKVDIIFVTVMPGHEDLVRFLELRGFRRAAQESELGEHIYIAEIDHPDRIYQSINRLAYDLLADDYRQRLNVPGPNQETPEYLAGLLTSRLQKPVRCILELGPGSGDVLSVLGKASANTIAVEISPRMAALAQEQAPESVIIVGDILALDFNDGSFDGVYAGAFLHLFPQSEAAGLVQKISRWTKSNGAVFVNTSVSNKSSESIEVKADYLHRVARFRSRWTEEQFRYLVESNGLRIIDRVTTDERERNKFWVAFICTPKVKKGAH